MNILFDENIPCGKDAFSTLGAVRSCPGRALGNEMLKDVDLLFVRSITNVNEQLLAGTRVSFVATATAGTDHVDAAYLERAGIAFSDALGSNANSVAEYVVAALMVLAGRHGITLRGKSIGIVGAGHVGSLVGKNARALGMRVLLNDPPRQRAEKDFPGVSLDEALAADIVTLHVPLNKTGVDRTLHLLDEPRLRALNDGCILIQSCRGAVVDNAALTRVITSGKPLRRVLDVWEGEPEIDRELLGLADIGTPHIAGYSWASKINGTAMVYDAACRFLGVKQSWTPPLLPEGVTAPSVDLSAHTHDADAAVRHAVQSVYRIEGDDQRMRAAAAGGQTAPMHWFDRLRKEYPVRFEFHQSSVAGATDEVKPILAGLGFRIPRNCRTTARE